MGRIIGKRGVMGFEERVSGLLGRARMSANPEGRSFGTYIEHRTRPEEC